MNITCHKCGKIHHLAEDKLPNRKFSAKCKQCGARMIIDPDSPDGKNLESTEWPATGEFKGGSKPKEFDVLLTEKAEENDGRPVATPEVKPNATDFPIDRPEDGSEKAAEHEESTGGEDSFLEDFPELQNLSPQIFVYKEILTAPNRKGYRTRNNIRLLKTIKALHGLLTNKILGDGEQVLRIADGIAYNLFEIPYANGLLTALSNYFAVICTDKRLLLINVNRRLTRPTRYIFQIPYEEIAGISRGIFLSSLIIKHQSGRRWNLTTVDRKLAKSIKDLISSRLNKVPTSMENKAMPNLCPSCLAPQPDNLPNCSRCGAIFKSPREALVRSLVLPGLGSIYLSYLPLGIIEMFGYLLSWLLTVVLLILDVPGGMGMAIIPVFSYHLAAGLLAWKTAQKGYLAETGTADKISPTAEKSEIK